MAREKAQAAEPRGRKSDAPERGGPPRSRSYEGPVMGLERRGRVIAVGVESTGNGKSSTFNGRRQPSSDGTSRMRRESQVRICEGLGVKLPGPTRQFRCLGI